MQHHINKQQVVLHRSACDVVKTANQEGGDALAGSQRRPPQTALGVPQPVREPGIWIPGFFLELLAFIWTQDRIFTIATCLDL